MIRRPPRSTLDRSSAASDVYKRQEQRIETMGMRDKIFDVIVPTQEEIEVKEGKRRTVCLLYTSPSPRDRTRSRMPSSA